MIDPMMSSAALGLRRHSHAMLAFSGMRLVLPSSDVKTIESISEVSSAAPPPEGVGWIQAYDRMWPVFALASDLSTLAAGPMQRRVCVVIGMAGGMFGLLCDEVGVLDDATLSFQPLPTCMRFINSPIVSVVYQDRRIHYGADAQLLGRSIGATSVLSQGAVPPRGK